MTRTGTTGTPPSYDMSDSTLNFIETVRYQVPDSASQSSNLPLPPGWNQYVHPNGDVYYRNSQLRLTTPDNIRRPKILQNVLDAREDHLELLSDDPNYQRLPDDLEMTIYDVNDATAIIGLYSRRARQAYEWNERAGRIVVRPKQHFWSHVAEYPSHHRHLPPGAEEEFVTAVHQAQIRLRNGEAFPFTEQQLDQIKALYERHKARDNIPALGWLIGVVMPLESVVSRLNGELEAMMEDLHV
ncbi:hypothetical protein CC2G_009939 [Coprinopsis cinerea AmutBmut pab1-1]|nr:hypothetical protein CC2G_009939 [Coprinopsis cinerea AmutBmut pab1-1]